MNDYTFYVYITTNPEKTVLYTGMTNDLVRRLTEHYESRGQNEKFAGKYYCYNRSGGPAGLLGVPQVCSECHRPGEGNQELA